jgi:hypothetical protein
VADAAGVGIIHHMGQVVRFPRQPRHAASHERATAAMHVLCEVGYLLGFFLAIPMLGLMAVHFASLADVVPAVICIGLAAVAGVLTVAAYKRI